MTLRMAKKFIFFSSYLHADTIYLQSLIYCLKDKFSQHLYEKKEGSGSESIPLTDGSGSEAPIPTYLLVLFQKYIFKPQGALETCLALLRAFYLFFMRKLGSGI